MKLLIFAALAGLAGCATKPPIPEPIIITKEVKVPVRVMISCVPDDFEGPPDYTDTDKALREAYDVAERYRLLGVGRSERSARLIETEAIIDTCRDGVKND